MRNVIVLTLATVLIGQSAFALSTSKKREMKQKAKTDSIVRELKNNPELEEKLKIKDQWEDVTLAGDVKAKKFKVLLKYIKKSNYDFVACKYVKILKYDNDGRIVKTSEKGSCSDAEKQML